MSRLSTRPVPPLLNIRQWGHRRALVALLAVGGLLVAAVVGAALSGSGHPARRSATSADSSPVATARTVVTRWWSVPGAAKGSRIDPLHPTATAATLSASRSGYCTALKQTVSAGKSILPDATATDPKLRVAAEAFVSELTALAPGTLHADWQTVGGAVLALVNSRGDLTKVKIADGAAVQKDATAIAADAKAHCGVDVSSSAAK